MRALSLHAPLIIIKARARFPFIIIIIAYSVPREIK